MGNALFTPKQNAKLIILQRKSNRGKTETLNLLIRKLCDLFGAAPITRTQNTGLNENNEAVLTYKKSKIGITTVGDDAGILEKSLSNLGSDCDLYVCACRRRGSSKDYLEDRFSGHIIMWQDKWSVLEWSGATAELRSLQSKANDLQALALVDAIHAML